MEETAPKINHEVFALHFTWRFSFSWNLASTGADGYLEFENAFIVSVNIILRCSWRREEERLQRRDFNLISFRKKLFPLMVPEAVFLWTRSTVSRAVRNWYVKRTLEGRRIRQAEPGEMITRGTSKIALLSLDSSFEQLCTVCWYNLQFQLSPTPYALCTLSYYKQLY